MILVTKNVLETDDYLEVTKCSNGFSLVSFLSL